MKHRTLSTAVTLSVLMVGCLDNSAPGNDREARLDPPTRAAQVAAAGAAISGVETGLIQPEIITEVDLTNVPNTAERCRFRMTKVGFPVVMYGSSAMVKLNGQLVPLPGMGNERYGADGVQVTIRPLEEADDPAVPFEAEFVLTLPGAPNELGFHGFATCGA